LVSSWLAYYREIVRDLPSQLSLSLRKDFSFLRPFIRSGEDYILIQELLHNRVQIENQQQFDSYLAAAGPAKMKRFKQLFYKIREELVAQDRNYWLSLNAIYRHVKRPLKRYAGRDELHIVSTKRSDFIAAILSSHGIDFPQQNIHYANKIEKVDIVADLLCESRFARSVFVDDQIDHLPREGTTASVESKLAAWGYVKQEWLDTKVPGIEVLSEEGMTALFNRLG
jgi:hypothetical protein